MSKFGEIVNSSLPALIIFYDFRKIDENNDALLDTLKDLVKQLNGQGKVIRIDTEQNNELSNALSIRNLPTFMIYQNGKLLWRDSGYMATSELLQRFREYI